MPSLPAAARTASSAHPRPTSGDGGRVGGDGGGDSGGRCCAIETPPEARRWRHDCGSDGGSGGGDGGGDDDDNGCGCGGGCGGGGDGKGEGGDGSRGCVALLSFWSSEPLEGTW